MIEATKTRAARRPFRDFVRALRRDKRGNVLMMFGFSVIPLTAAVGIGVDYSQAARIQTKLNAIADAAALSAVTQTAMLNRTDAQAQALAQSIFDAQAAAVPGVVPGSIVRTVTATRSGATVFDRLATVTYTARTTNNFGGLIGMQTTPIGGSANTQSAVAPNIDFYVLLDTSPSMALPATTAGLTTQIAATGGCAFACHQTQLDPDQSGELKEITASQASGFAAGDFFKQVKTDGKGNVTSTKYFTDYYGVARLNGIPLRFDNARTAIAELTDFATDTAALNGANYRMALASFDTALTQRAGVSADMPSIKTQANAIPMLRTYKNNMLTSTISDNDQDTDVTAAMGGMNLAIPAPGNGGSLVTDTPQKILFIVTDGMRDENSSGRKMGPWPAALCTTIKNRGIRIAILYTEYLAASASDGWSISNVRDPYLSPTDLISPAMQACASQGLYYKVTTDSDISAALKALFQKAVQTARIIK